MAIYLQINLVKKLENKGFVKLMEIVFKKIKTVGLNDK